MPKDFHVKQDVQTNLFLYDGAAFCCASGLFLPNVQDLFLLHFAVNSFKIRGASCAQEKRHFGDEARTQMDENYTKDVNFASIINKFQVHDIAS